MKTAKRPGARDDQRLRATDDRRISNRIGLMGTRIDRFSRVLPPSRSARTHRHPPNSRPHTARCWGSASVARAQAQLSEAAAGFAAPPAVAADAQARLADLRPRPRRTDEATTLLARTSTTRARCFAGATIALEPKSAASAACLGPVAGGCDLPDDPTSSLIPSGLTRQSSSGASGRRACAAGLVAAAGEPRAAVVRELRRECLEAIEFGREALARCDRPRARERGSSAASRRAAVRRDLVLLRGGERSARRTSHGQPPS